MSRATKLVDDLAKLGFTLEKEEYYQSLRCSNCPYDCAYEKVVPLGTIASPVMFAVYKHSLTHKAVTKKEVK